jgi:hypothetical protein
MQKLQIGLLGLPVHGASRTSSSEAFERNDSVKPSAAEEAAHQSLWWTIGSRMLHTPGVQTFATMPLLVISL